MKSIIFALAVCIPAFLLSACGSVGPSDSEAIAAFENVGWVQMNIGIPQSEKEKVHVSDCSTDTHDKTFYVCTITIDGYADAKARLAFTKDNAGKWVVALNHKVPQP